MPSDKNQSVDELYEAYKKKVEELSSGLVETNKSEFIKFIAYQQVVMNPALEEYCTEIRRTVNKAFKKY